MLQALKEAHYIRDTENLAAFHGLRVSRGSAINNAREYCLQVLFPFESEFAAQLFTSQEFTKLIPSSFISEQALCPKHYTEIKNERDKEKK